MIKRKEWIIVKTTENLPLAELDKQLLEKEEIPVMLRSGGAAAYMGAGSPQEILVPRKYLSRAKKILKIN